METRVSRHIVTGNTLVRAFPASRTSGLRGQPQPPQGISLQAPLSPPRPAFVETL